MVIGAFNVSSIKHSLESDDNDNDEDVKGSIPSFKIRLNFAISPSK